MKKFAIALMCLAVFGMEAFGQSNRSTRPRVAVTPTPAPPTIYDEDPAPTRTGRPPVLQGDPNSRRASDDPDIIVADDDDDGVIRVETNLVTMPVSVLDRNGRFVSGLRQQDFRIFENGAEQKVDFFQSVEQPFTVVLMIDVSPSTAFQMDQIYTAASAFVDQLRPMDRVMVVAFDERVRILSRPTNDRNTLYRAIRQAEFGNGTSLYGAVDQVMRRELSMIEGRKAIVLFTDGVDTTSGRASFDSTIRDVEERDVLIYPIRYDTQRDGFGSGNRGRRGPSVGFPPRGGGGLGDVIGIILGGGTFPPVGGGTMGGTSSREYEIGRQYLETLASTTGGRHFEADSLVNLDAAFSGIAEELRRQYSIGYYPEDPGNRGDRKQIMVRVMRPNLVVRAKTSYIVGAGANVAGR